MAGQPDPDLLRFKSCERCPAVDLLPENFTAWEVFQRTYSQVLTVGMGEVIGVNISAVVMVMDIMQIDVKDRAELFDKVTAAHSIYIEQLRKKSKKAAEDARNASNSKH